MLNAAYSTCCKESTETVKSLQHVAWTLEPSVLRRQKSANDFDPALWATVWTAVQLQNWVGTTV